MKRKASSVRDSLRPEYEFDYSTAVRGKFHPRLLKKGTNVVVLDPDVAAAFPDSAAVNDALRSLLRVAEAARKHKTRKTRTRRSAR